MPILLAPGVNHVLFKSTLEDYDDVALRYVDAVGRAVAGLTEIDSDHAEPRTPVAGGELPPVPPPFIDGLDALHRSAQRRGDETADESVEIASTLADLVGGQRDRGFASLWRMRDAHPSDPKLSLALAECFRRADDLPNEIGAASSRKLVEGACDALPEGYAEATLQKVALLRSDDRLEDAERLLETRLKAGDVGPRTFAVFDSLLDALHYDSRQEQIRKLWIEAEPYDARALSHELTDVVESGRAGDALKRLDARLEKRPGDQSLLRIGVQIAANLGDRDHVERYLAAQYRHDPDSLGALKARADALSKLGATDDACAVWKQALAHEDADADDFFAIGFDLWSAGHEDEAVHAFRHCLSIDPSRHAVRQMLNRLADQPDMPYLDRFRVSRDDVDKLVASFQPTEREAGAPSTLMLDRMTVVFYPDGSRVEETHQLRRINDLNGVTANEQAENAARADEVVRLRTIGADGQSYVPQRVQGSFAMPRLEPGAFVEQLYRDYHPEAGAEPWRGPDFWFQGKDEPFVHSVLTLVLPPGAKGSVRTRNYAKDPEVVELDDGWRALIFERRDMPRLPREPRMPDPSRIVPIVTYGQDRAYGELVRRTSVAGRYRAHVTAPVAEATAKVLADVEPNDTARLAALHAFVNDLVSEGRGRSDRRRSSSPIADRGSSCWSRCSRPRTFRSSTRSRRILARSSTTPRHRCSSATRTSGCRRCG